MITKISQWIRGLVARWRSWRAAQAARQAAEAQRLRDLAARWGAVWRTEYVPGAGLVHGLVREFHVEALRRERLGRRYYATLKIADLGTYTTRVSIDDYAAMTPGSQFMATMISTDEGRTWNLVYGRKSHV